MTDPTVDLACRQHGLTTLAQARRAGLSDDAVFRRVHGGLWVIVHDGVYRVAGAPVTFQQRLLAACLAIGPEAAASHRSSAAMRGFMAQTDPPIEVTTTRSRSPELDGVIVHRLADLDPEWITIVDGVPCTTVARTLVDLGAVCRPWTVERALDKAIGRNQVRPEQVRTALIAVARKGRRGVGTMRTLLEARGYEVKTVGVLAARMLTLLRRHGLPEPEIEHTVTDEHGGFVARVDFAYPWARLVIEVDGYESHSPLREFRHDRKRRRALVNARWRVVEFTWDEVDSLSPYAAREIRSLLGTLNRAIRG